MQKLTYRVQRNDKDPYKYNVVKVTETVILITGFSQAKQLRDELTSKISKQ